ncbi:nuclear transport factor 2 family protein [Spirillospora sp. NPDC029432]|uniref:nuclear transport factor 2 family protein n=1 Tax=Spirillospora sp. NPDC029432 TaxID=3154599 RepID=UPI003452901E
MVQPIEKIAIAEVATRLFHALDAHDWQTIGALTTDSIDLDYPSKQGGPELVSADDFVSGLRSFLPGFDATQHLLGPIVVEPGEEPEATARFDARVTHLITEAADAPIWVIGCHYTLGLTRRDGGWKLCSSRVRVLYEEGNRDLEAAARQRAQPSSL